MGKAVTTEPMTLMNKAVSINGLILAGGKSTRMGKDKALLDFHGVAQWKYLRHALAPFCEEVWLSVTPETDTTPYKNQKILTDTVGHAGPLNGILTALRFNRDRAWLVVACDMPNVNGETLRNLIEQRQPAGLATAYAHPESGYPEPMPAIWEPNALPIMEDLLQEKPTPGPIALLKRADCHLAKPRDAKTLINVNTPEDFSLWEKSMPAPITITVSYFAKLRAQVGKDTEEIKTRARTAAALYEEVEMRHDLPKQKGILKVAVNDTFCGWETTLNHGDKVVFIPPVSGG